jgi:hypothetical protein
MSLMTVVWPLQTSSSPVNSAVFVSSKGATSVTEGAPIQGHVAQGPGAARRAMVSGPAASRPSLSSLQVSCRIVRVLADLRMRVLTISSAMLNEHFCTSLLPKILSLIRV